MKIRPIILCGGEGTRLWHKSSRNEPKQFINFGGWTLIDKTLNRIKGPIFDFENKKDMKTFIKLDAIAREKMIRAFNGN